MDVCGVKMKVNYLERQYDITVSHVNAEFTVTKKHIFEMLQDIATDHADMLGFGWHALNSEGKVFVLSKMCVELDGEIRLGDCLTVTTWPTKPNRFFADREFVACNQDGQTVLRATSRWCLLDLNKRSIINPDSISHLYDGPYKEENSSVSAVSEKLNVDQSYTHNYDKVIRWSDLDMNKHVNNTNYPLYAMDCASEDLAFCAVKRIELQYHSEAHYGDVLSMYSKEVDKRLMVVGKIGDKVCFTAKISFC